VYEREKKREIRKRVRERQRDEKIMVLLKITF